MPCGRLGFYDAGEDVVCQPNDFDATRDGAGEFAAFADEDGFENHAAAQRFAKEVVAFDGDEAS
jgi:hypothetical protein